MISKDNLVKVGYLARPHSFKGEVQLNMNKKVALDQGDFIFLSIDDQFIPYPILAIKGKDAEPVLKIGFVSDHDQAVALVGKEVFLSLDKVQSEESEISLMGYMVLDATLGDIGEVIDVQEMPQQLMLTVDHKGTPCMIPLVEDFIEYISEEDKTIGLDLPPGLLDINA